MSRPPSEQGITSSSETRGNGRHQYGMQVTPVGHPPASVPQRSVPPSSTSMQRLAPLPARGFELPPLPRSSSVTSGSFPTSGSRSMALPSLLSQNSQDPKDGPRWKHPQPATSLPPLNIDRSPRQQGASLTRLSPSPQLAAPVDHLQRRFLTPRSPLQRATTLTHLSPSLATINARQTPFPVSSAPDAALPSSMSVPHLSVTTHQSRKSPPTTSQPLGYDLRRPSPAISTTGRITSQSASPVDSYSPYSRAESTSPGARYASISGSYRRGRYSTGSESIQPGIPISSSGAYSTYQMMSLETTSGTVQLPVETQAASRNADEKRRRNAGASARFRERRKKKEVEANTTIARFEQQVKDLRQDVDFYRRERDYFASVVRQGPGVERHVPRPQSPRHRRAAYPAPIPRYADSPDDDESETREMVRSVRQRTSSYLPTHALHGQVNMALDRTAATTTYSSSTIGSAQRQASTMHQPPHAVSSEAYFSHAQSTRGPSSGPRLPEVQTTRAPPPSVMQASPPTGPCNPFAAQRYERTQQSGHPRPSLDTR